MSTLAGAKYRWEIPTPDRTAIDALGAANNLTRPIAQTLYNRGYTESDALRSFLFTSHEQDVGDPRILKGAEQAVERLQQAITKKEKILIFGDYDVDGITSTSLFLIALLPLEANINFYLPNRRRDGYGLSTKVVKKAVENGYDLIITVDNGISAHDAAQTAADLGIDLIITDHHRPHSTLPPALCIVNPNQPACDYPHKELAGVGVSFKLLSLLYQQLGRELPNKVYELLMLGTIADVVPLITENRFWVRKGLMHTNQQRSYAMHVLAENGRISRNRLNSLDIGFMIAPQLNALGRLDDPRDAVKFLISADKNDVQAIGKILKNINEERKKIDRSIYQEIEEAITENTINLAQENLIMAAHQNWPAGVIGLVAGKLMHNYGRPSILFHLTKDGLAKGSCRSIPAFNMFDALEANKDLLISFGGHSLAAGLSLKQKDVPELKRRLEQLISEQVTPDQLQPKITIDSSLALPEMNRVLMQDLERLEPFGNSNPQPTFLIKNVCIQKEPVLLKDAHVKCSVFADGIIKPIIFFNRPDIYKLLSSHNERPFHVAGHVTKNEWNGKTTIELQGLDIAFDA